MQLVYLRNLFPTPDTSFSFDSILFYGKEWMLLQLDILVFAVVDLVAQNYVLAAIVTLAISLVKIKLIQSIMQ